MGKTSSMYSTFTLCFTEVERRFGVKPLSSLFGDPNIGSRYQVTTFFSGGGNRRLRWPSNPYSRDNLRSLHTNMERGRPPFSPHTLPPRGPKPPQSLLSLPTVIEGVSFRCDFYSDTLWHGWGVLPHLVRRMSDLWTYPVRITFVNE